MGNDNTTAGNKANMTTNHNRNDCNNHDATMGNDHAKAEMMMKLREMTTSRDNQPQLQDMTMTAATTMTQLQETMMQL